MPYASTPQFGSQLSLRAPSPGSAPADVPNKTKRAGARGDGRGRKPGKTLQKSFSTESSLNHMVPNSPIHPDAAMRDDGSRETSPTKGNKTPSRKLSPPKHLEAPIVEVTENDSSEENREQQSNPEQADGSNVQNGDGNDTKEQNGQ